jgi:hypothetical protein
MMEDNTSLIRVINNTDNPKGIIGRYAGKNYHFKKGVPLDVPEVVAQHVFAFGLEDKSAALNRLGWARTSEEIEAGMEMLGKIVFDDPPEMIEAPKKTKGKKASADTDADDETGTAGPPVNAGGTKGVAIKGAPDGPKIGQDAGGDAEF